MSEETKETKPGFDSARLIEIKRKSAEGDKTITLRFPTDAEWIERQRKRKIIIRQLGRGMSETIVPETGENDLALVGKLRSDSDGPEVDGYEATWFLDQLAQADVDDVTSEEGGSFLITLRVPGAITTHLVRMPSAKEIFQYRRAFSRLLDMPFGKQELTVNLVAAGDLYSKLCQKSEGYASPVPIIHQVPVVKAAIEAIESGIGVAETPNFSGRMAREAVPPVSDLLDLPARSAL